MEMKVGERENWREKEREAREGGRERKGRNERPAMATKGSPRPPRLRPPLHEKNREREWEGEDWIEGKGEDQIAVHCELAKYKKKKRP